MTKYAITLDDTQDLGERLNAKGKEEILALVDAAPAPLELYHDFSDDAPGTPVTADSGQTWTRTYSPGRPAGLPQIVSGKYVINDTASGGSAGYLTAPMSGAVTFMEGDIEFGTEDVDTGGSAGLIAWHEMIDTPSQIGPFPDAPFHIAFLAGGFIYDVVSAGVITNISGYVQYDEPILSQHVEVAIDAANSTAYLLGADGNTHVFTDPVIGSVAGMTACAEVFYNHADTERRVGFTRFGASAMPIDAQTESSNRAMALKLAANQSPVKKSNQYLDFFHNFVKDAPGLPTRSDSGHTFTPSQTRIGAKVAVASSALHNPDTATGASAGRLEWDMGESAVKQLCYLQADFKIANTGSTSTDVFKLAAAVSSPAAAGVTDVPVILTFKSDRYDVGFYVAGTYTAVATDVFYGGDITDLYVHAECAIDYATGVVWVRDPVGTVAKYINGAFSTRARYGYVESAKTAPNTDDDVQIYRISASSQPSFYSPDGQITPGVALRNEYPIKGYADQILAYASSLPTFTNLGAGITTAEARGNHTGSQLASTISDFAAAARTALIPRVTAVTLSATPALATDNFDQFNFVNLNVAITSMTANLTGTPTDGREVWVRFTASGADRAIAWGAKFTGTLLATALNGKTHLQQLRYDATAAKWAGTFIDTAGY